MVDRLFAEPKLAEPYDLIAPWGEPDDWFYLPLVLSATSILDVGCGTGLLLRKAREAGHTGRLCGLDPAAAMLDQARSFTNIEWLLGDLSTVSFDDEFDLVVMTGHAFQVFLTDDEIRTALAAIRSALVPGGRFAFETRNPLVRGWERWTAEHATEVVTAAGEVMRVMHVVDTPVVGEIVRFTSTYTSPTWDQAETSQSALRFLDAEAVARFLSEAGLMIEEQYGDWDRSRLANTSPEIITICRWA